jgi:phytoene dehydrogenase-like protein
LKKRFPESAGKIETADTVTPMTYTRYTGIWKGSYMGWWGRSKDTVPVTLPGVKKLYIAGQWTRPSGGIAASMISGSECIKKVCMEDEKANIENQK